MLDSQLSSIYLAESIDKDLKKIKLKSKQINISLKSSNILKIHKTLNFLKDTSDEDLSKFIQKKYNKFYKKSEKKINLRIGKTSQKIKNLLIVFDTCMSAIKDLSTDSDIQEQAEKSLKRIDKSLSIIKYHTKKDGLTTLGAALVIQQLIISSRFVLAIFGVNSSLSVVCSSFIAALGLLVIYFIDAKKNKKKVIN